MGNRQVAEMETVEAVVAAEAVQETPERYPNRFKPGQSGNPAGRPKKTKEEEVLLDRLKHLTPMALEQMEKMLKSERVAALAKVRIIEIILERTFGKVESNVKVTNTQESVEAAAAELEALFASWDEGGETGAASAVPVSSVPGSSAPVSSVPVCSVPVAGGDLQ